MLRSEGDFNFLNPDIMINLYTQLHSSMSPTHLLHVFQASMLSVPTTIHVVFDSHFFLIYDQEHVNHTAEH